MCTSISFSARHLYGRTLDLEVPFGEQVVITPREYPFRFRHRPTMTDHFAMIGMASVGDGTPLYAEAMNEKGLYMAGLNFPGTAYYFPDDSDMPECVAPFELIPLILGSCASLREAKGILESIRLIAVPFAPGYPIAPLHWHIADASGSITAEPMEDGLHLYDNPAGVLTNNPPFPFQMMHLNAFQNLSPKQPENTFAPELALRSYGQGMGAIGLPGDVSPTSRFVRACFLKANSVFGEDRDENIMQFFHVLDAVSMVRGSVITPEGKYDETMYSSCADAERLIYCYRTYTNIRPTAVRLTSENCLGTQLKTFALDRKPDIRFVNDKEKEQ